MMHAGVFRPKNNKVVFVCNVRQEILGEFNQNRSLLQHRQQDGNQQWPGCLVTLERHLNILQMTHEEPPSFFERENDIQTMRVVKKKNKKNPICFCLTEKWLRNLRNKKVTLRVYCIQEMENTSLLTP